MNILNLFFRASRAGVAEPDVGAQKVLLIEEDHAVAESMMKMAPEKMVEQLGLLRIIGKNEAWKTVRNISHDLRNDIGIRG